MKCLNKNIKFLYTLIIISSFINFLGVIGLIPTIKIINLILWFIIFVVGIFITKNDYNHFYNVKDKVETIFIILIIYFMIYFSLGLIFGFNYNIYANNNIYNIFINFVYYILPIIFYEYVRGILCSYSSDNKHILIFISILFMFINFDYINLSNIKTGENFLKFLCINLIPLISTEFSMTYISKIGGYKLSLIYKILTMIFLVYLPILPNLNFFLDGFIKILIPVIVYMVISDYHEKEIKKTYVDYSKKSILEFVPFIIFIGIFVCNTLGIFKYQMYSIMSDSMNPLYYKGDAIIMKKLNDVEKEKLKVGDIIVYEEENSIIIHRIHSINTESGEKIYITKGDNNNNVDSLKIKKEDIKGKYLFNIKFLGYPRYVINELLNSK